MTAAVITWQDVINVAAELASIPEPAQTSILAFVGNKVPANQWGADQGNGQAWLAAHLATISRRRGEAQKTQKSAGGLSMSYADMTSFGALGQTSYGVEYQRLVRQLPTVAFGMVV